MDNIQNMQPDHDKIVALVETVKSIKESSDKFHIEVKDSFRRLEENYSHRIDVLEERTGVVEKQADDFKTVKNIVYGAVGLILVSVFSAIIYLVIIHH